MKILLVLGAVLCVIFSAAAQEPDSFVPKTGVFPPPNVGTYLAGELVEIDHVNRRGAIRLFGDGVEDKYHTAPPHRFALLPYGTIRYHGAPAELRDVPIGTVLHGYFVQAPDGDKTIPPPVSHPQYVPKQTHALTIEDDSSFYQRRTQNWKIVSVDAKAGKLKVSLIGPEKSDGLKGEKSFDVDASTRVWKGRQLGTLGDLSPEQNVQINLSWAPNWLYGNFFCTDIWLDKESLDVAAEAQRQTHIRYQRIRGLAAVVDTVEHGKNGNGTMTATIFAGMDATLYEEFKSKQAIRVAAAETTLRTWWQDHDNKFGTILEVSKLEQPPTGSSGIRVKFSVSELLEGFRPGRIVRLSSNSWPRVKLPPEERVKNMEERQ